MTILQQILVGDEFQYRDVKTGIVYTALEARRLKGPITTRHIPPWEIRRLKAKAIGE